MRQESFSVYDKRTGYFHVPFFSPTIPSGKRNFQEACRDTNSLLYRYPEDYELYHVGSFDDESGSYEVIKPVPVMGAVECVANIQEVK